MNEGVAGSTYCCADGYGDNPCGYHIYADALANSRQPFYCTHTHYTAGDDMRGGNRHARSLRDTDSDGTRGLSTEALQRRNLGNLVAHRLDNTPSA